MTNLKTTFSCAFSALAASLTLQLLGYDVTFTTAQGDSYLFEFHAEDSMQSVVEALRYCGADNSAADHTIYMSFANIHGHPVVKAYESSKALARNYDAPVSVQEKKDLAYILKTLANSSLAKIAKEKANLKKAGDRIDNLHPFKFFEAVFTDEELKVYMRNLEGKSWVWTEFRDGVTKSLAKESAADNLKLEYVQGLANALQIDINQILPTIVDKNWSKLVTDLIAIVPRSGDSNRYNM